MNAKISVLVICFKAIIYLLLYNLHDCTFDYFQKKLHLSSKKLYINMPRYRTCSREACSRFFTVS